MPLSLFDGDPEEPLGEADRKAITALRENFRYNLEPGISFEEFVVECGFSMEQVLSGRQGSR